MEQNKFDLAIGVAIVPLLGTSLVLVNQLGRFLYYGIPPEMLELDAYKILVSGMSMLLVGGALLYTAVTFHRSEGPRRWHRLVFNLTFAAILTGPFWIETLHWGEPISWATVLFVSFTGSVLYGIESWLQRKAAVSLRERIAGWTLVATFGSMLLLLSTLTFGAIAERERTQFSFVYGTNDAVIARAGDVLITKTYDPKAQDFDRKRTKLLEVSGEVTLESRTIVRR